MRSSGTPVSEYDQVKRKLALSEIKEEPSDCKSKQTQILDISEESSPDKGSDEEEIVALS